MLDLRCFPRTNQLTIHHRPGLPDIQLAGGVMLPHIAHIGISPVQLPPPPEVTKAPEFPPTGTIVLPLHPNAAIASGELRIERRLQGLVVQTTYRAACDHVLAAWTIAPPGSLLRWNYLANFRNRHHYLLPYKQVSLDGHNDGCFGAPGTVSAASDVTTAFYRGTTPVAENTYSQDWQFAPHPTSFIFQAPQCNLLAACLDLPHGFGMHLDIYQHQVTRWEIDLGGPVHGQKIRSGDTVRSPAFIFALDESEDVYHTARLYHDLLVQGDYIPKLPDRSTWPLPQTPFACTWLDQGQRAGHAVQYHENGTELVNAQTALTTALIDEEIALLRRTGTPYGLFGIDDGWAICRGDWEMHPQRLAGIRERIDQLHDLGIKVLLWWAPFDIHPSAKIRQNKSWLAGGGVLGRHGMPLIDYSNPVVQREYLAPLARLWYSSDPGCYNADGVKTDFMADKIHPEFPIHDPQWRGEERFILNTLRAMSNECRKHKPVWVHQGCSAHPYFESITSTSRCYDNASSDYRIMFERERMLQAFQPANPVHTQADWGDPDKTDLAVVLDHALATGSGIEFTGTLGFGERPYTPAELTLIDTHVRQYNQRWKGKPSRTEFCLKRITPGSGLGGRADPA